MLFSFFYFEGRVSVLILISVLQSFLGERYAKILTIFPKILLELLSKIQQLPNGHFSALASLRSQAFVHLLAFQKPMKTEACTRRARPEAL